MKYFILIIMMFLAPMISAELTNEEQAVQADIKKLMNAVDTQDIKTIISFTHERIFQLSGGKENLKMNLKRTMDMFKKYKLKIVSIKFPSKPLFFSSKKNNFCFVPTEIVMSMGSKKRLSSSYQIGVKKIGAKNWTYVDGSNMTTKTLLMIFPDFPKDKNFQKYRLNL